MKHLMLTTALTTATAFGAMAQTASGDMSERDTAQTAVPAFLSGDITGKTLYTLDSDATRAIGSRDSSAMGGSAADDSAMNRNGMSGTDGDRTRWTSSDTFLADRDSWDDIGDIEDIVMTMDGKIRGVLLDVGGFLGFGSYQVMVDIEDLHFVTDDAQSEDIDDFFVVIAMSQDQLGNLAEWDGEKLRTGFDTRADGQQGAAMRSDSGQQASGDSQSGTAQATQAAVFGQDHTMLEGEERTADRLMGADVYDANGENIGSVRDIVLDGDSRISHVLVDVGGFLGMGAHMVKLPIGDAQIGWSDTDDEARVQVTMTGGQLEDMPAHEV